MSTTVTTPPASAAASSVTGSGQAHQPSVRYTSRLLGILGSHLSSVSGLSEAGICQASLINCCTPTNGRTRSFVTVFFISILSDYLRFYYWVGPMQQLSQEEENPFMSSSQ